MIFFSYTYIFYERLFWGRLSNILVRVSSSKSCFLRVILLHNKKDRAIEEVTPTKSLILNRFICQLNIHFLLTWFYFNKIWFQQKNKISGVNYFANNIFFCCWIVFHFTIVKFANNLLPSDQNFKQIEQKEYSIVSILLWCCQN